MHNKCKVRIEVVVVNTDLLKSTALQFVVVVSSSCYCYQATDLVVLVVVVKVILYFIQTLLKNLLN